MIYGVTPCEDGTFLITGSPDTTRYQTLQEAMRAAGKLNAETLDKTQTSRRAGQLYTADGSIVRKTRYSKRAS